MFGGKKEGKEYIVIYKNLIYYWIAYQSEEDFEKEREKSVSHPEIFKQGMMTREKAEKIKDKYNKKLGNLENLV